MYDQLTKSELFEFINKLNPRDREELFFYMRELDSRTYYQLNPADWIADKLDVDIKSIIWSRNPGYAERGYIDELGNYIEANWDGTPDPINALLLGLARWKDVAVESGTGLGKTFIAAATMLWFLANFHESQVITVAPKQDQLERGLWKEVDRLFPKFKEHYPEAEKTHLKIRMAPGDDGLAESWVGYGFVCGVSAGEESAAKAQGIHGEHLLFIFEETVGIPNAILEAIENTCTDPHNLRLFLGNPSGMTDPLHMMFTRDDILGIRVSGYDHPNIINNDPLVPVEDHVKILPYYSWKSILTRRIKYGPDPEYYNNHPLYKSRVRGICPSGSAHSLFTNKVLDVVEVHLKAGRHRDEKEGRFIDELSDVWGPQNVPPLAREWDLGGADPRLDGVTRVYFKPRHTHVNRYLIFGDVAEDSGTGDAHAAIVYDRIQKRVAALIHMRGPRQYYAAELVRMGKLFATYHWDMDQFFDPVLCWERNAPGALHLIPQFTQYPNLYLHRTSANPKGQKLKNSWGWYTTSKSRPEMITALEEWGIELRDHPERIPDERILSEMQTFEWKEKRRRYEARTGTHDDIMMALAGALVIDKLIPAPEEIPEEPDASIKEHWMERKKIRQELAKTTRRGRGRSGDPFKNAKVPSWGK